MKNKLIQLEKEFDDQLSKLSIWKYSFQSIMSVLLYTAENLDFDKKTDTAMDFISRLSLIYPYIKNLAIKEEITTTREAVIKVANKEFMEDINFLISYAHFSMLMPQIHRGTLQIVSLDNNKIRLDFPSTEVFDSELLDKLYSFISLQIVIGFPREKELKKYLTAKATDREYSMKGIDFHWVSLIYKHHKKNYFNIHVLPDKVLKETLGFNHNEYYSFIAALKAFSDFYILLSRKYREAANAENSHEDNEKLMSEYIEWSVCCLKHQSLGWFLGISDLDKTTFDLILSYFLDILSNNTGEPFVTNAFCGDGYFPPITLYDKSIIFSPQALRYLLNINNILYSANKNQKKIFDEFISPNLEPTLISQLEYIFSHIPTLKIKKNINYSKSEIDLLILSETEKTVLIIQVKTTIAPDSSRTVARVEARTLEGLSQIEIFESLAKDDKLNIVNRAFDTELSDLKFINIIIVRSSAGSHKAWKINANFRIANYALISRLICDKINNGNLNIQNIDNEIKAYQEELVNLSESAIKNETLKIGDYEIVFPNIIYDDNKLISYNFKTIKCFRQFESSEH